MRWRPSRSSDMPWWGWLLIPLWGPALLLLICLLYALKLKRMLLGPSDDWQPWFAWYPARIRAWDFRDDERVWLEWIERRAANSLGDPEYRVPASTPSRAEGA